MKRLCFLSLIVLAATALLLGGCGKKETAGVAEGKKGVPLVNVLPAKPERISRLLNLTGEVVATNTVWISAMLDGPISFCPWREGDRVEDLQKPLIEISRPVYRQEVKASEAALAVADAKLADLLAGSRPEEIAQARETVKQFEESAAFAKADMERTAKLVSSGSLKAEDLEKARVEYTKYQTGLTSAKERLSMLEAGPTETEINLQKASVEEARAKLELAKAKEAESVIFPPFQGVITKVLVRPGDMAVPKMQLLQLMDTSSLRVRFMVPEKQSPLVAQGSPATVEFDAHPGRRFNAVISRVYPELDTRTRTRTAEAQVKEEVQLVPGMFARVSVAVETAEDAMVVPDAAVLTNPRGDKVVFVVVDGKASARTVKTGIEQGRRVQILEGILPGDRVVVAGNQNLKDGVAVRLPKQQEQPSGKKPGGGQP
jgi:multidrug efflux pump subunit AcrA (membrane-fusion protein)